MLLERPIPGVRRQSKLPTLARVPQVFGAVPTEKGGTVPADGSPAGTDYPTLREQWLDHFNIWRGVLTFNAGTHVNTDNRDFNVAIARAVHDWNADTWLTYDKRLYGVVCPPVTSPDEAAREIRRVAENPRIVAILLPGSPWARPYGDPLFHSVYDAAQEVGLPVDVHIGISTADRWVGGVSAYSSEAGTFMAHDAMHHLTSLIVHGVFEKFPKIRFLVKEYGIAWLPYVMWKLDENEELLRLESPWVKRRPSDYLREHVILDTQPLDEGRHPDELKRLLGSVDGIESMLAYASDYPHCASDDPNHVARRLPDGWQRAVMCDNACRHYGWSPPAPDAVFEQPALAGVV
jgi:predicted TIM-barrel fold metal-dependent hydrolase